jgi:Big-like domain-containing protein/PKD domain-containing protein
VFSNTDSPGTLTIYSSAGTSATVAPGQSDVVEYGDLGADPNDFTWSVGLGDFSQNPTVVDGGSFGDCPEVSDPPPAVAGTLDEPPDLRSGAVTPAVNQIATTTTLASSDTTTGFGQPVTFTATVTGVTGPVTVGFVTFTDVGNALALVALDFSGQATFETTVLGVGTHRITATFSGATGFAASSSTPLDQVVDGAPDAGGPYTIVEGNSLTLDASASLALPFAFDWDVNGDGTFDVFSATPTLTLTWAELESLGITDGTGTPRAITLRVHGLAVFIAVTVLTVENVAPTATFSNDGPVDEGSTATVTFAGQSDPSADDLAALVYSYDFDNDGTFEETASSSSSATVPASLLADGPGTRTVRAVVADDDGGSFELTTDITVDNAAATATISGPSTAAVGVPVTLKVGASDPSPADMAGTFDFTVDWGDGTPSETLTGPADPPVTHTYTSAGTFTFTATATDPDGATSDPLTFTITVTQQVTTSTAPTTSTTPTTTSPPTTQPGGSTTAPGPTTIPGPTTTPDGTTATTTATLPGATTIAPGGGVLPRTGGDTSVAALIGLALLVAGVVTVVASRRVGPTTTSGANRGSAG